VCCPQARRSDPRLQRPHLLDGRGWWRQRACPKVLAGDDQVRLAAIGLELCHQRTQELVEHDLGRADADAQEVLAGAGAQLRSTLFVAWTPNYAIVANSFGGEVAFWQPRPGILCGGESRE
jgi:hypothetical protein